MRKRIFEIVELSKEDDTLSKIYDFLMIFIIILSTIPLAFKTPLPFFVHIEKIVIVFFIIDYFLRLLTADYKLNKGKWWSFIIYPFTPMAIIDLLSILPSLTILHNGLRLFKIFRLLRSLRILRVFKIIRYSSSMMTIINIFKHQKEALLSVCTIAIGYVLISALIIINVEPESFDNFFDAIYWATVSLTTVGYGDIYPVSTAGKIVTMVSSVFGIAVIALPASIITAGLMEEIEKKKNHKECD